MNILIISKSDINGGAAIASYRLMNALRSEGLNVRMLVSDKKSDNPNVVQIGSRYKNQWNFYRERGEIFLHNHLSKEYLFDVSIASSGVSITELEEFRDADVIHLHWINQGMLSIKEIDKILHSGKKVVWTMHDMWPFTGICHHAGNCNNYEKACGVCPYLSNPSERDLSNYIFKKKKKAYSKGNITFVACSEWLKRRAEKSPLTKGHKVISIPNPIDTDLYKPMDKFSIRRKLNLPTDKKLILFAAAKASDPRKGTDYLVNASKLIAADYQDKFLFLIVGNQGTEITSRLSVPSLCMGYVDSHNMPEVYNSADVYITPSLQENLPNTIMEAMSSGTPCVGFEIGGIPEMINHKLTGYIARYKDTEDLANGINWTLLEADSDALARNSREKVLTSYEQSKIATFYRKIYEE
ncbi:MAG: glycosyltransferase family 4 protein [Fermentimonas sp.]|nr:glycosyltransferase family 4 protein [Fermentimonas sp.]